MKSLKGAVLSSFSYSQTQKFCAEHPTVFDCDWDLWREKATADFGISGEFFDLVSQLPGSQRYLQIKSYYTLTPDMAVRVYEDGFIEGVYEAYAGYERAYQNKDYPLMNFFAARLKDEQVVRLVKEGKLIPRIQPLSQELIDELNSNKDFRSKYNQSIEDKISRGGTSLKFLNLVLSSGRTDWIDQVLHRFFSLPEGFSIEKDIPYVPFWAEEFPVYDLPLYRGDWLDDENMFSSAIKGANVKVVDFFRSIMRHRLEKVSARVWSSSVEGLEAHGKPEEIFGIYKRFKDHPRYSRPFMIEQALDSGTNSGFLLENNLGNVPYLLVSLPFLDRRDFALFRARFHLNYPLSDRIIHEYVVG